LLKVRIRSGRAAIGLRAGIDGAFVVANVTASYRPGAMPEYFDNTKAVLLTLARNPPGPCTVDFTKAEIVVIEDAMMDLGPVQGLRRLLAR
jgi:hypothetical protein